MQVEEKKGDSRHANLESNEVDCIRAYGVEIWIPPQEVCETDSILAGHVVAGIVRAPCVCLTGWRCAKTGTAVDGCVKFLAVNVEPIGVKHAVSGHAHSFGHGVAVVARLKGVRASASRWTGELSGSTASCCSIDTEYRGFGVRVPTGTAAGCQCGKVAC